MESPNLGPELVWNAGYIFAFVGILAVAFIICYSIYWFFSHLQWV